MKERRRGCGRGEGGVKGGRRGEGEKERVKEGRRRE